jgi:CubicO group peptidase (beta-lactamase class C family)
MDVALADRVDAIMRHYFVSEKKQPGLAWGVVQDGVLVHHGGLGTLQVGENSLPTSDSVFRIASMTKSFVAAAILLLRDEGKLRLDDKVEEWVPELLRQPSSQTTKSQESTTIRQLLSMAGGLPEV